MKEGDLIPPFRLMNQNGEWVEMEDYIGKKGLVLFFYPKDHTPGCTKEARAFNAQYDEFNQLGVELFGISGDDYQTHKSFCDKNGLSFPLLSDKGNKIRKAWKVPASLLGFIPGRVSYVIDRSGRIRKIINSQLDPHRHIEESLATVKMLKEKGEV